MCKRNVTFRFDANWRIDRIAVFRTVEIWDQYVFRLDVLRVYLHNGLTGEQVEVNITLTPSKLFRLIIASALALVKHLFR